MEKKLENVERILYIKLGQGGDFEKECLLEKKNILKLDYKSVPHEYCIDGDKDDWERVRNHYKINNTAKQATSNHVRQIREFYTASDKILWITFYANKMWWCFSEPIITQDPDNTKTRPVIGTWSSENISGVMLLIPEMSGLISQTQSYRGTICEIEGEESEKEPRKSMVLAKINGVIIERVDIAKKCREKLKESIEELIQLLTPQDFEILIDLIFRYGGWQRLTSIGSVQKTLDLDLENPLTGERAMVQVKSSSNQSTFDEYLSKFKSMKEQYSSFYYVLHTTKKELVNSADFNVNVLYIKEIADLSIKSGLVDWIIKRTS